MSIKAEERNRRRKEEKIEKELKYISSIFESLDKLYEFDVKCEKDLRTCKVKIKKVG